MSPGLRTAETIVGFAPTVSSLTNGAAHSIASKPIDCSPCAVKNTRADPGSTESTIAVS